MEKKKNNIDLRKAIARHCKNKNCNNLISHWNRSGICSNCHGRDKWKDKYDNLEREFERHKELCRIHNLEMYNKLKKHEPNLTWADDLG